MGDGLVLVAVPGNEVLARALASRGVGEVAATEMRQFPDGEWFVRLTENVAGREVAIVAALHRPDDVFLPAVLAAATARDLGATRVGLIAPYLAYLRQDARFQPGEGVTSRYFGELVSRAVDWMVTVDPHLHRYRELGAVYSIPTRVAHAAPALGRWIADSVRDPLVVGPDGESAQWAEAVASIARAPSVVLQKARHGDADVVVTLPDIRAFAGRTPVLVDDIISTRQTMMETVQALRALGFASPECLAVHAVFADGAYDALHLAGAARIATCNTIEHPSNSIDVSGILADAIRDVRAGR